MNDDILSFGKEILASQPFSKMLGTQLDKFENGVAELSLELRDDHKQQHGFAHGGIVSYLADNALTFAGGTVLGIRSRLNSKSTMYAPPLGRH